jgi:SET domain-containing protein
MRAGAAQRSIVAVPEPAPASTTPEAVEVRRHRLKGRAVFARRPFAPGDLIDAAPVIVVSAADSALLDRTVVGHYYFHWAGEEPDGTGALALGLLSLCNHSARPRARVHRNFADETLELVAVAPIASGEEITIAYGCKLWFEPSE